MSGGSPKPKWAGRLNSAVRRSSTMLSFGRTSSSSRPSSLHERERDSFDNTSLNKQKIDTTPATLAPAPAVPKHVVPSPINESPMRETAATEAEAAGPSPLGQDARTASPEPMDATSPIGYVPPPLVDSSIGNPGAFTDQADELPQPVTVSDPFMPSKPGSMKGAPSTRAPSVRGPPVPASGPQPEDEIAPAVESHPSTSRDGPSAPTEEVPASAPTQPDVPARLPTPSFDQPSDPTASHFDPSQSRPPHDVDDAPIGKETSHENGTAGPTPVPPAHRVPPIPFDITGIHPMPVPTHEQQTAPRDEPASSHEPVFRAMPINEWSSGAEIWGEDNHGYDQPKSNGSARHDIPSIKSNGNSDPFSPPIGPRITVSSSEATETRETHMPEPHPAAQTGSQGSGYDAAVPLPPLHQVSSGRPLQRTPSSTDQAHQYETDETQPLLGTPKGQSYLQPPTTARNTNINVSPLNGSAGSWNPQSLATVPRLHDLGWIEYHLPDGTFYYVHPTRRVTTDVNLRTEKVLNSVTALLENVKDNVPSGCEMWLRDIGNSRKGFVPGRSLVNHQTRSVVVESEYTGGKKKMKAVEEDQLDMEYRYWSFMEGHPAHTSLPLSAKTEAFEALSWAWTDRLLPSNQVVPAPFTQDECQELNSLLRSFNADQDGIQTRLVARILIRVAIWRQAFFRPNKPLPKDVVSSVHPTVRRRRPIIRSFFDIVISIICLGIPYIFYERHAQHRIDEESNFRAAGPMFIIGACTCIVAAIVLSAAVTFLSLPGLDSIARIAGLVATLFASFSMAATLVAIFRYKADMVRSAPQIGEGIMWVSKRSLIFSLPMVFLAYAIIGFITAIVLYYIRGVALTDTPRIQSTFGYHTRWTTVSAVGALAGALTMSILLFRR